MVVSTAGSARALPPDTCEAHVTPSIGMSCGDHELGLSVTSRYRAEYWDSFASAHDTFHGIRSRIGVKYSFRDTVVLFAEFQDARVYDLGSDTSGVGALYRRFGGNSDRSSAKSDEMRQYWAEIRPIEGLSLKGGRQDIKLGTQALYDDGAWKYLKVNRASQRLVGTVGWSNVERSNDAFSAAYDTEDYHFYGFAGKPTTGVFDHVTAYETQSDIVYGGISVTAKRGAWLEDTEVRPFFLAYSDDRPTRDGGLPEKVEVYTLGFSAIGVYPLGPGNVDVLLWGAGQTGRYDGDDHLAYAAIGEAGYRFTEVWSTPWIRTGINFASGDGNGKTHNTFFNLLPTNHLYYGFADQLAFQNLVDIFAQVTVKPHERVALNVMFHQFFLPKAGDAQYFGTGAFNKKVFGFGANATGGERNFGQELDVIFDLRLHDHVSFQSGYAHLWGSDIVKNQVAAGGKRRNDLNFAYWQVTVSY